MKNPCPDCGHQIAYYADECPKCACWVDMESIACVRMTFFIVYFLAVLVVFWLLGQDVEAPARKPASGATPTALEAPGAPQP